MTVATDVFQFNAAKLAAARRATQLLVGTHERLESQADRAAALLGHLTPQEVLLYWGHERVVALAVQRAGEIGVSHDAWREADIAVRAQARDLNDVQEVVSMQVTRALAKVDIASVVFKGAYMARELYGDRELRGASGDIDVLVAAAELDQASAVLQRLGWHAPTDARIEAGLPNYHLSHDSPGQAPEIELHWRVQWYDRGDHTKMMLARANRDHSVGTPSPTDSLSTLLFCYARDGFHKVRLAADIAAWWDRHGHEAGKAAMREFAAGALARPLLIAAQAAESTVGIPGDAHSFEDRAARAAVRVAAIDRPLDTRHLNSQIALVDVLIAPSGQRAKRWRRGWLRDTGAPVRRKLPWWSVPVVVPMIRLTICARTAGHAAHTAWIAVRQRQP